MKRIFTMLIVVALIFSLVGCGNNNASAPKDPEETSGNQTMMEEPQKPIKSETENHQDNSGTAKKYDNPGDDPRMIAQVNWKSGYYAFIDQYNLIGYATESPNPEDGACYYFEENYGYIPESTGYKSFYTPATGESGYKVSDGDAFVDLEGWANSYDINVSEMYLDGGTTFCIETTDGKVFCIGKDYYRYSVPKEGGGKIHWRFYTPSAGEPIYGSAFGEKHQISNDVGMLWAIEKGFEALESGYSGNPW